MKNSKAVGELSEAAVLKRVLQLGYSASIPFGNNQRYDLILDAEHKLFKVQIKTAHFYKGCLIFSTCSRNGFTLQRKSYEGEIDLFLAYASHTDKVYKIPVESASKTSISLRISQLKRTAPLSTVRWAKDFEF